MSNLIKSVYFNVESGNKKTIKPDNDIKRFEYAQEKDKMPEGFEFVPGINVLNIDEIIEEQHTHAYDTAEKILADARSEAAKIIASAREEAEKLKEQARAEGYAAGFDEGNKAADVQLEAAKTELADRENILNEEYNNLVNELEPEFALVVGELVEKITGVVVEETDVLHYLIDRTLKQLPVSESYCIHVCPEKIYEVEKCKDELKAALPEGAFFDIVSDESLNMGQCLVETPTHMLDCGLDTQLKNLKQELRIMSIQ